MPLPDALFVGANLAALVAAEALVTAGRSVVLLTDGRPPGGHLRGLTAEDAVFDVGMVLLEPTGRPDAVADPRGYRPEVRYDWTRSGGLVDAWVAERVEPVRTPTPQMHLSGRTLPDFLVADRLDVLAGSGLRAPAPVGPDDPRHASAKRTGAAYDRLTYAEAARANHGDDVHRRLVAPFATKLLGAAQEGLLARHHRSTWLPLYWPGTVRAGLAGQPVELPEAHFAIPASGAVADLVRGLEQRLTDAPGCVVDTSRLVTWTADPTGSLVRTAGGSVWSHPTPVVGLPTARAGELLELPAPAPGPAADVLAVCCLVRADAIGAPVSCLSVVDPEFLAYRVTDQDVAAGLGPGWHRVVVEAGPVAVARSRAGEDVSVELAAEAARLLGVQDPGDVRVVRTLAVPGAVPAPTAVSVASHAEAVQRVADRAPGLRRTGVLLGTGVSSLNDQVVQGLAVAAELS